MRTLTIGAASLDSALGFLGSLRGFQADLVETAAGSYDVRIALYGSSETHKALRAIDDHLYARSDGAARLDFNGQRCIVEHAPKGATQKRHGR